MLRLPQEGEVIQDRYVVERRIGRGGFAAVYRCWDRAQRRPVAIKIIMPQALNTLAAQERLLREARLASCLQHPNTVLLLDSGRLGDAENGLPYLVMEFLSGETLGALYRREKKLSSGVVTHVLLEALGSLGEAHEKGVIHRDLKPDNIFLCDGPKKGRVKVLDFGIARAVDGDWGEETMERLTLPGALPGTAAYMAPEFFTRSGETTAAVDVYALACMAFKLLTGRPPFEGPTATAVALKHIKEPPPPLPDFVDRGLAEVISRALSKRVEHRYADANHMREALGRAAEKISGPTWGQEPESMDPAVLEVEPTEVVDFDPVTYAKRGDPVQKPKQDQRKPVEPTEAVEPLPLEEEHDDSWRLLLATVAVGVIFVLLLLAWSQWSGA